jgi:O-antigen/teichoic acid export membrane protein
VRKLWYSPTLRSVVIYGASGLGFAGANLILARVLATAEYGLFTLVIALVNLSFALAPLGVDGIVNRRRMDTGYPLLKHALTAALSVGAAFVVIAAAGYHMSVPLVLVVFVSTVAGGAMAVAGAQFQSEQRYGISLALTQSPNLTLIIAAAAVVVSGTRQVGLPLGICALGFVVAAGYGWWVLFRERPMKPPGDLPSLERSSFFCRAECRGPGSDSARSAGHSPCSPAP